MGQASETESTVDGVEPLASQLSLRDRGTILLYGPAMSGKRAAALDLLVETSHETGASPFYVSTSETVAEARGQIRAHTPDDVDLPRAGIVTTADEAVYGDEFAHSVGAPGDLAGIATGLTSMIDGSRRSERLGSVVAVDNLGALLVATDLESVYRFLHALTTRVAGAGGYVVATLDSESIDRSHLRMLAGTFDEAVEIRTGPGGDAEYRRKHDDDWHAFLEDSL